MVLSDLAFPRYTAGARGTQRVEEAGVGVAGKPTTAVLQQGPPPANTQSRIDPEGESTPSTARATTLCWTTLASGISDDLRSRITPYPCSGPSPLQKFPSTPISPMEQLHILRLIFLQPSISTSSLSNPSFPPPPFSFRSNLETWANFVFAAVLSLRFRPWMTRERFSTEKPRNFHSASIFTFHPQKQSIKGLLYKTKYITWHARSNIGEIRFFSPKRWSKKVQSVFLSTELEIAQRQNPFVVLPLDSNSKC